MLLYDLESKTDFYSIQLDLDAIESIDNNKDYGRNSIEVTAADKADKNHSLPNILEPKLDITSRRARMKARQKAKAEELKRYMQTYEYKAITDFF